MTTPQIRLEEADTPALRAELAALAHVIWYQHYVPIIGQAQVDYMLATNYSDEALADAQTAGTRYTLVRRGERSVAYAAVSPPADNGDTAWLDKLYVLQDARNLGIGGRLVVRAATQAAGLWHAQRLALRVNRDNTGAIAAYRALGFEFTRSDVKDIGGGFVMDDHIMSAGIDHLIGR